MPEDEDSGQMAGCNCCLEQRQQQSHRWTNELSFASSCGGEHLMTTVGGELATPLMNPRR
jgi:hypothetical protein